MDLNLLKLSFSHILFSLMKYMMNNYNIEKTVILIDIDNKSIFEIPFKGL
jgi:hypothetical protein